MLKQLHCSTFYDASSFHDQTWALLNLMMSLKQLLYARFSVTPAATAARSELHVFHESHVLP